MCKEYAVAIIGLIGVVSGAAISIAGHVIVHCLQNRKQNKLDEARKALLKSMLERPEFTWRSLDKLMHVVGADEETIKRLLLELGARASEDGKPLWGLISRNPFANEQ